MSSEQDRYVERRMFEVQREYELLKRQKREQADREFHERLRRVGPEYEDGTDFGD